MDVVLRTICAGTRILKYAREVWRMEQRWIATTSNQHLQCTWDVLQDWIKRDNSCYVVYSASFIIILVTISAKVTDENISSNFEVHIKVRDNIRGREINSLFSTIDIKRGREEQNVNSASWSKREAKVQQFYSRWTNDRTIRGTSRLLQL